MITKQPDNELGTLPTTLMVIYKVRGEPEEKQQAVESEEKGRALATALLGVFAERLEMIIVCKATPEILEFWA